ncbi:MAG: lysophospholipid acyltransferase family protein [Phycisphaeraceae bacterium]
MTRATTSVEAAARAERARVPRRSPWLIRLFAAYVGGYARRHFHAVRVAGQERLEAVDVEGPLVIYLNHPSWWDPLIGLLLARRFFPGRRHYAPIDEAMLSRYRFFDRLGFFGVEPGSMRGGLALLRASEAILGEADTALWLTAQGVFRDPRVRPVALRSGVGHVAARLGAGTVLPVALEYPFWQERLPEALVEVGEPVRVERGSGWSGEQWTRELAGRLEATMDRLAERAIERDAGGFRTLVAGRSGVGGVYDVWRRMRGEADLDHPAG